MECRRSLFVILCVVYGCSLGRCDVTNRTTLFSINLRSLTRFNFTAFRHSVVDFFRRLENRLNATYRFLRYNGSLAPLCGFENDECSATAQCCPNYVCVPSVNVSDVFNCRERNESSSEEVGNRIDGLYTDSSGSHEWANSWAFESRSTFEREEEQYKEDKEWNEKNVLDSTEKSVWNRLVNEIVSKGKEQFHKLQKMKKFNEVKRILQEKIAERLKNNKNAEKVTNNVLNQGTENDKEIKVIPTQSIINIKINKKPAGKSQENVENSEDNEIKSEENLSSVLKSAEDLVKRNKKKHRKNKIKTEGKTSEISWNEDELQKEIQKLKSLKEQRNSNKISTENDRIKQDEMNELIKKQVALILDEERKLEGLMKLEELKKLEENMKRRGS